MKKWWYEQWQQTKDAAAYCWKYEIGWSRIVFIIVMGVLILALGEVFSKLK